MTETLVLVSCLLLSACRMVPAPEPIDLVLQRADNGKPYSFRANRAEATLVFFFSTWCVLCQAMEPTLAEVLRRGAPEGIDVVAIALDLEGRATVSPYVWASQPPYPVLVGGESLARGQSPFGVIRELPTVVYLDRDGRSVGAISGLANVEFLLTRARQVQRR